MTERASWKAKRTDMFAVTGRKSLIKYPRPALRTQVSSNSHTHERQRDTKTATVTNLNSCLMPVAHSFDCTQEFAFAFVVTALAD